MKTTRSLRTLLLARTMLLAAAWPSLLLADSGQTEAPAAAIPAATTAPDPAMIHNQLRAVRDAMLEAWGRRDIDAVLSHVEPDVVVTWQNGEVNRGPEAIRQFYKDTLEGENSALSNIVSTVTVDDLSVLHGADTAIAAGSIHDEMSFKRSIPIASLVGAGKSISLDSRWTATLVHNSGEWKVASYHVSANLFSNPVLELAMRGAGRAAGIGGFIGGAAIVLLIAWLRGRTTKPRETLA